MVYAVMNSISVGMLNRLIFALGAAVILTFTPSGSVGAPAGRSIEPEVYFPSQISSKERKYSTRITVGGTNVTETVATEKDEGEVAIKGKRYIQSTTRTPAHGRFKARTTSQYLRYTPEGVYQIDEKQGEEYARLRFPMTVGKKWSVSIPAGGGAPASTAEMPVVGFEDVKIGGKMLKDCLRITERRKWADGKTTEAEEVYAPHIGYVKSRSKTGRTLVEMELLNP